RVQRVRGVDDERPVAQGRGRPGERLRVGMVGVDDEDGGHYEDGDPTAAGVGSAGAHETSMAAFLNMDRSVALSSVLAQASRGSITFFFTRSRKLSFMRHIPYFFPVCMIDGIWKILASRMRFETEGVTISTSSTGTRPPPIFLHRTWDSTPLRLSESMTRIWLCRSAGNWSMIRSTVEGAEDVWSVPNTRWPVSAVSIAMAMVSRSRISPTS